MTSTWDTESVWRFRVYRLINSSKTFSPSNNLRNFCNQSSDAINVRRQIHEIWNEINSGDYFSITFWLVGIYSLLWLFFLTHFCGSFACRLMARKNQSLEKQMPRLERRTASGEGWRMMNQFYKHFIVVAMARKRRVEENPINRDFLLSTWWADESERNLLCCWLFNHLLSHSKCNGWKSIM